MNQTVSFETAKGPVSFNVNDEQAAPATGTQGTQRTKATYDVAAKLKAATAGVDIRKDDAVRAAAEAAVRDEVITSRLGGDGRMFNRWRLQNDGYWRYRVGLAAASVNGIEANVKAADAVIAAKDAARKWRLHNGGPAVVSPSGIVMTARQARLLGYEGE